MKTKKFLVLAALALTVATSLIAGTLAVYNIDLDPIESGSIVAKEFKLTSAGDDEFATDVKIAPTETVTKVFTISNFNGSLITETAMKLDINVQITNANDKLSIDPLKTTVYKVKLNEAEEEERFLLGEITSGTGAIPFIDGFGVDSDSQTYTYEVDVVWPSNDEVDIDFAGDGFGNKIIVSVSGRQILSDNLEIK